MFNYQKPEKVHKDSGGNLFVHSIFKTIQGEGPFCGVPAIFVRLAGCNLQCPGCDTDYTSTRVEMSHMQILTAVRELIGENKIRLVVITGGEPFRQEITALCDALVSCGFTTQIETNGTLSASDRVSIAASTNYHRVLPRANRLNGFYGDLFIVCSPKTGTVHPSIASRAACYKYIISHDSVSPDDGLPLSVLEHPVAGKVARPPEGMVVYLQPMDAGDPTINELNLQAAIESCTKFGYILQLQTHKIMGLQ